MGWLQDDIERLWRLGDSSGAGVVCVGNGLGTYSGTDCIEGTDVG